MKEISDRLCRPWWLAALLGATATPASAQELRDFCADRPGLGTPACTLDPGHVMVETAFGDWTLQRDRTRRTDTLILADTLVRIGLDTRTEAQIGWAAYGHQRSRDRMTGAVDRDAGVGDVSLALRRNLSSPDGSGTALAAMMIATLPVGGKAIGAGDWGASFLMPFNTDLTGQVSLEITPEIDTAVDQDRSGRHLAYGGVVGLDLPLTHALSATPELAIFRDNDPSGRTTKSQAALALAWQRGHDLQFDAGCANGLNRTTDDLELYVGIARRF
jgi:hypothetical protein